MRERNGRESPDYFEKVHILVQSNQIQMNSNACQSSLRYYGKEESPKRLGTGRHCPNCQKVEKVEFRNCATKYSMNAL